MGERGHTVHVVGDRTKTLNSLGRAVAVLGVSPRWTSFVPLDLDGYDDASASRALKAPIVRVWFDDEQGLTLQLSDQGFGLGEISLPCDGANDGDRALLQHLVALKALTADGRDAILAKMGEGEAARAWVMAHGVERAMELPAFDPVPTTVSGDALLALLPEGATVIEAKAKKPRAKAAPVASDAAPTRAWSEAERRTVDLHVTYWSRVWSPNDWALYKRYKKHLAPSERADVDRLCDAVAEGDDDALRERVSAVLARVWDREDWDAVIRDPKLAAGEGDDARALWAEALAAD